MLVQAEGGICAVTGTPEEQCRIGVSACDVAPGMFAHAAVLQALYEREKTGKGKAVKASLFSSIADGQAEIGRGACRARVWLSVLYSGVTVSINKNERHTTLNT